jgi:hypothetical protein
MGQTLLSARVSARVSALWQQLQAASIMWKFKNRRHLRSPQEAKTFHVSNFHFSVLYKTYFMGWHKKWFAGYGWVHKVFKSRQIMNTECGKESVPLVVNKRRDTKSSFNNISTKLQHETCRGRKHHQERERYKLYRMFRLSPYRARQLWNAESLYQQWHLVTARMIYCEICDHMLVPLRGRYKGGGRGICLWI